MARLRAGAPFDVRVTPRARREELRIEADPLRVIVRTTAVPEKGRANARVIEMVSEALGVPKSRLELLRGASGRDKRMRVRPD